ncbi:8436_t:CDS:2, partial [Ambispora gerdemannii]
KEVIDWKKLVRICKDRFDERYNILFEGRDDTSATARNALKLRAVVEKIIEMLVNIKDEIELLPVAENRTPPTPTTSTTYSPPRSY